MEKLLITDIWSTIGQHLKSRYWDRFEIFDISADLTNYDEVESFILQTQPSFIIHLAEQYNIKNKYKLDTYGVKNTYGTVNLIKAAEKLSNFKLFTYHSVYDDYTTIQDYSKYFCEKIFEEKISNLPYCVLKLPTVYGDYVKPYLFNIGQFIEGTVKFDVLDRNFKIERIIYEIKNKREIVINQNLHFQLLFIDDLLKLYDNIFDNIDSFKNTKLSVQYENEYSIKEINEVFSEYMEGFPKITTLEDFNPLEPPKQMNLSIIENWKPRVTLIEGAKILIDRINQFDKECNGL